LPLEERITPAPPAVVTLPAFVAGAAEEAIPQMIAAEREASRTGDLPLMAQLWAEDARIADTRGTREEADDFVWPNRAAILNRYEIAVFPAPPPGLEELPSPQIIVEGDSAVASNGNDTWHFVWRAGSWWLAELRY
jgi:hypothetical protein